MKFTRKINYNGYIIHALPTHSGGPLDTWSACQGYTELGAGINCINANGKQYSSLEAVYAAAKRAINKISS